MPKAVSNLLRSAVDKATRPFRSRPDDGGNEDKPHACGHCPTRFKKRCDLVRHEKIHLSRDERDIISFKCDAPGCSASFLQKSGLRSHQRIHTGERLSCPECEFKTSDDGSLSRHRKKRHGHVRKAGSRGDSTSTSSSPTSDYTYTSTLTTLSPSSPEAQAPRTPAPSSTSTVSLTSSSEPLMASSHVGSLPTVTPTASLHLSIQEALSGVPSPLEQTLDFAPSPSTPTNERTHSETSTEPLEYGTSGTSSSIPTPALLPEDDFHLTLRAPSVTLAHPLSAGDEFLELLDNESFLNNLSSYMDAAFSKATDVPSATPVNSPFTPSTELTSAPLFDIESAVSGPSLDNSAYSKSDYEQPASAASSYRPISSTDTQLISQDDEVPHFCGPSPAISPVGEAASLPQPQHSTSALASSDETYTPPVPQGSLLLQDALSDVPVVTPNTASYNASTDSLPLLHSDGTTPSPKTSSANANPYTYWPKHLRPFSLSQERVGYTSAVSTSDPRQFGPPFPPPVPHLPVVGHSPSSWSFSAAPSFPSHIDTEFLPQTSYSEQTFPPWHSHLHQPAPAHGAIPSAWTAEWATEPQADQDAQHSAAPFDLTSSEFYPTTLVPPHAQTADVAPRLCHRQSHSSRGFSQLGPTRTAPSQSRRTPYILPPAWNSAGPSGHNASGLSLRQLLTEVGIEKATRNTREALERLQSLPPREQSAIMDDFLKSNSHLSTFPDYINRVMVFYFDHNKVGHCHA